MIYYILCMWCNFGPTDYNKWSVSKHEITIFYGIHIEVEPFFKCLTGWFEMNGPPFTLKSCMKGGHSFRITLYSTKCLTLIINKLSFHALRHFWEKKTIRNGTPCRAQILREQELTLTQSNTRLLECNALKNCTLNW